MSTAPGTGRYYEDMAVGDVYRHSQTRTVTEMDNVLFSSLTLNAQPLHIDEEYARRTPYGTRVVNGVFVMGLVIGMTVPETVHRTSLGVVSFDEVQFLAPVHHGDTLQVETEILDKRQSNSRPGTGLVTFEHRGYKQGDIAIMRIRRKGLMLMRPPKEQVRGAAPSAAARDTEVLD